MLLAMPLAAQGSETDDFDTGLNNAGWNFGVIPADVIEPTGGNPNGWLHNDQIDMFTVILRNDTTTGPWVGDYRAAGVSRIHFDAQTLGAVFGAAGRDMSILLRDTKGTALVDDDDYAYYVGHLVPQVGAGWKHFNFEIPSQSTDPVPFGWKGGWVGDGENFRPGVDWNDVITNVDVVEIWWMDPSFFAIFQTWNVGVDNLTIEWGMDAEVSIAPGLAGVNNTISMVNASPNSAVRFAGSTTAGTTNFNWMGDQMQLGMGNPREVGVATADAAGNASVMALIPASLVGTTIYLQGFDSTDGRLSAPLVVNLP